MSVCGWGSRELTSKQGTFPLIMLHSFWLLDWAICSQLRELGGEEFLCVSICLWQTKLWWSHVEGDSWRRKCCLVVEAQGRAGCSELIPAVALLPHAKHEFGHSQGLLSSSVMGSQPLNSLPVPFTSFRLLQFGRHHHS